MIGWEDDPELAKIRQEFIESLHGRYNELKQLRQRLIAGNGTPEDGVAVHILTHKLAGIAATYGFPTLSEIAGAIDDLISSGKWQGPLDPEQGFRVKYLGLLERALGAAIETGKNPVGFEGSPELKELTSFYESLPD